MSPSAPPIPTAPARAASAAAAPCAVCVRGLCVAYGSQPGILDELDLDVHAGERLAILGPSGSGKTTLLACIAQRIRLQAGDVRTLGPVALIHQDLRLVPQASVLANVLHGSLGRATVLLGFPPHERAAAIDLVRRVGLGHRLHARVSTLSGGEQQRVAIARALMQQPAIILADEPVASLDPVTARQILALLTDLASEREVALVAVLHDPALAREFCSRTLYLDRGRLSATCPLPLAPSARSTPAARCGAQPCDHASTAPHAPSATPTPPDPLAAIDGRGLRPWTLALLALVVVIVYAWAFAGIGVDRAQLAQAPAGLAAFLRDLWPASFAQLAELPWAQLAAALLQTIQMSLIATTLGAVLALPLAFLAARNLAHPWVSRGVRQLLNVIRTLPALVWALLFVAAVGFGPLAGVLALIAYTLGYLTKFFYEAFESAATGPQDALALIGASRFRRLVHAVWPAALPLLASSSLFMLEYNVRAASILGIVDAGGIGWHIKHYLDYRHFPAALACLALVLVVVIVLDAVSTRVRAWATSRG